jgi:hypothetical protein
MPASLVDAGILFFAIPQAQAWSKEAQGALLGAGMHHRFIAAGWIAAFVVSDRVRRSLW